MEASELNGEEIWETDFSKRVVFPVEKYNARSISLGILNNANSGSSNVAVYPFIKPFSIDLNLLPTGIVITVKPATKTLEESFSALSQKWKKDTRHYSVIARRYQHDAYKAILKMKKNAISLILADLRNDPDRWFDALQEITGENPAAGSKNFYEAVDKWVAWGIANNYIK